MAVATLSNWAYPRIQKQSESVSSGRQPAEYVQSISRESSQVADSIKNIRARLDAMRRLESNWDSFGGQPPSEQALGTTRSIIGIVIDQHLEGIGAIAVPFTVAPIADGGAQVEWRNASKIIEVEVSPHGEYGCLLINKEGPEKIVEERDKLSESAILELISSVLTS